MIIEHRKQQRLLIWIVLGECSDGDAGSLGDARGRQSARSVAERNLNSRLSNRLHRDRRPRLNRRLSWLKCG
jgi:hypothetical protein